MRVTIGGVGGAGKGMGEVVQGDLVGMGELAGGLRKRRAALPESQR